MSLIQKRWQQLKEYRALKRNENQYVNKFVTYSKERDILLSEYEEFKRIFITTLDALFKAGKSKVVIRPNVDKVSLYEILLEDEEFNSYYKCNVIEGTDLEITMIEL